MIRNVRLKVCLGFFRDIIRPMVFRKKKRLTQMVACAG